MDVRAHLPGPPSHRSPRTSSPHPSVPVFTMLASPPSPPAADPIVLKFPPFPAAIPQLGELVSFKDVSTHRPLASPPPGNGSVLTAHTTPSVWADRSSSSRRDCILRMRPRTTTLTRTEKNPRQPARSSERMSSSMGELSPSLPGSSPLNCDLPFCRMTQIA